jgi:hypothetical protein
MTAERCRGLVDQRSGRGAWISDLIVKSITKYRDSEFSAREVYLVLVRQMATAVRLGEKAGFDGGVSRIMSC